LPTPPKQPFPVLCGPSATSEGEEGWLVYSAVAAAKAGRRPGKMTNQNVKKIKAILFGFYIAILIFDF
jgi:hypothetical protein